MCLMRLPSMVNPVISISALAKITQVPVVPLAPIDEENEISQPQQGEIIVPVASLAPQQLNLPLRNLLDGSREEYINVGIPLYKASIKGNCEAAKAILDVKPELVHC